MLQFLAVSIIFPYFEIMMTVKQYADKREIPVATVYSWISRNQAERNGFRVIKIGKVSLIEEVKKKPLKVNA